jgi:hypothetical protein
VTHPQDTQLALYASRDLPWWPSLRLRSHLSGCAHCRAELHAYASSRKALHDASIEFPSGLHWGKLAAEMKANIRLGLAAGEIAGPVAQPSAPAWFHTWRIAGAMASITIAVLGAYWLSRPVPVRPHLSLARQIVLKASPSGVQLEENGSALALMHRGSEAVTLTVGAQGSLRARYLDEDTGEVTIHHVYAE